MQKENKTIIPPEIENSTKIEIDIPDIKVDKKLVHKKYDENVFISEPIILNTKDKIYRIRVIPDFSHKFFFDHELKHLPGMLLMEAARQFGTAYSHKYLKVPFGPQFILDEFGAKFTAGALSDLPVYMDGIVTGMIVSKKNEIRRLMASAYLHQNKVILGNIFSSWSILPDKMLDRIAKKFK